MRLPLKSRSAARNPYNHETLLFFGSLIRNRTDLSPFDKLRVEISEKARIN
jgi:hypothetical protein